MSRSNNVLAAFLGVPIVLLLFLPSKLPTGDVDNQPEETEDQKLPQRVLRRGKRVSENISLRGTNLSAMSHEERARVVQTVLTQPTTTCRKLIRVGGRSCRRHYDGSKLVCFDAAVRPTLMGDCLTYSFGVGNDFTFDEAMQDYGCEVHSFDDDKDHRTYVRMQGPKVHFHAARVGIENKYVKYCEDLANGTRHCRSPVLYQTMERTRRLLKHEDRVIDYFKMDIEGSEWAVFLDTIANNPSVLPLTKQIGLEIHLENLSEDSLLTQRAGIASYLKVLQEFEELGFMLAKVDNNDLNPSRKTVDGINFSIYAE
ncbi:unnamed protein product, partial [Meganyctiphanes norvegica]